MTEFREIRKRFGDKQILRGIDLTIRDHEVTYIIGASGTGKSVLMKHAVGLLTPDYGSVVIDGKDMTSASEDDWRLVRRRYALVFQHPTLFDSMTIHENVALPLMKVVGLPRRTARDKAMEYLKSVRMEGIADLLPADVGPSERKRVAIARSLTLCPDCAILDEPTTGLDVASAANIDDMIRHLSGTLGKTVVVISHDLRSIFGVAHRIIFLYKGQVHQDGTPATFRASTDALVQQFIRGEPDGPMET